MDYIVEIDSDNVRERQGTSNGRDWHIREQRGYFQAPDARYPKEITFTLEKEAPPYSPGRYAISPESFYISKYGQLQLSRSLQLEPVDVERPD